MPDLRILAPALLAALAACTAPAAQVPRPPATVPVIVLSQGTSEWGFAATEIYADDTVISIQSEGIGRPVRERAAIIPGAYDRVAAVLRHDGPAAMRATGPNPVLCPGSQDTIAANPPLGRFAVLAAPCGGNTAPFRALYGAAVAAIAPPG